MKYSLAAMALLVAKIRAAVDLYAQELTVVSYLKVDATTTWSDAGPYTTVQCTSPAVTNAADDQATRWNDAQTGDAWEVANINWFYNSNIGININYPEFISNFFNGPEGMNCGDTVENDGCNSATQCNDVDHPAGYFILNSMVSIHGMLMNYYNGLVNAESYMTTQMGAFASTFAPIEDTEQAQKIFLDIIGFGFALVAAPTWNSLLKGTAYFKANPNMLGTIKDWINPILSNTITLLKESDLAATPTAQQTILEATMGKTIQAWASALSDTNSNLFNGSVPSIANLYLAMVNGQVMESTTTVDDLNIQNTIMGAMYPFLIPQAWALSNEGIHPFILDSGLDCSNIYPEAMQVFIEAKSTANATYTCYNNRLYYLLSATGSGYCPVRTCSGKYFSMPPGVDQLDGTTWGPVTRDDIVQGAVNGYSANGNANGWSLADPLQIIDNIWDEGSIVAGYIQLPICSGTEALTNWMGLATKKANYPCN